MPTVLKTAPAVEPLALDELKLHLRVDHDDEDTYIEGLALAARRHVEQTILNRALITQTWNLYLDRFPGRSQIRLPYPPLQSVTGVYYTPEGDSEQTYGAANYHVDVLSRVGRVVLEKNSAWPGDELQVVNGVRVEFVAGYGDEADDVPEEVRRAMLLIVGDLYENREETVGVQGLTLERLPFGMAALLADYRIWPGEFDR